MMPKAKITHISQFFQLRSHRSTKFISTGKSQSHSHLCLYMWPQSYWACMDKN